RVPTVLSVTEKVAVPAVRAAFIGSVALTSLDVIAAVSVLLTTFQFASTAFTVTLNALPAVCAAGEPVLPLAVPGAAVSPGIRISSEARAAGHTVTAGTVAE